MAKKEKSPVEEYFENCSSSEKRELLELVKDKYENELAKTFESQLSDFDRDDVISHFGDELLEDFSTEELLNHAISYDFKNHETYSIFLNKSMNDVSLMEIISKLLKRNPSSKIEEVLRTHFNV